jgi:hypothetical protein
MQQQETEIKNQPPVPDQLQEIPALSVEAHLKITEPESATVIVNMRA